MSVGVLTMLHTVSAILKSTVFTYSIMIILAILSMKITTTLLYLILQVYEISSLSVINIHPVHKKLALAKGIGTISGNVVIRHLEELSKDDRYIATMKKLIAYRLVDKITILSDIIYP